MKYGDVIRIRPGTKYPSDIQIMVIRCHDPYNSWAMVIKEDTRTGTGTMMLELFPPGEVAQFNPTFEEWEVVS